MIDLRSDTVTLPTLRMRSEMARAEVGDDVYGEDPTVNRLEALAAERVGKDAGLFVTSGTMANLVAMLTFCGRGDEVILGDQAHTFMYEAGGSASLGGIHHYAIPNQPDGTLDLNQIQKAIRAENVHFPRTRLICLENTQNRCGGVVLSAAYTDAVGELAHEHGLRVYLDGARLFNAAVALQVDASELTRGVDAVGFCLSKGLSAPVGSVLCGEAEFVREARRWRKAVGGGMRQAGILAAAGIVALEDMVDRMAEDHENARLLAEGLAATPGIGLDPQKIQTNIIYFDVVKPGVSAADVTKGLRGRGVLVSPFSASRIRVVTHYGISREDVERTVAAMGEVLG